MESLLARATGIETRRVALPTNGATVIRVLRTRFSRATPDRLRPGTLAATYTRKPLVSVRGDAMFGELAVVRLLTDDGWDAVWVDTFHRQFWRGMPHRTLPVTLPPAARDRHDAIVAANGGREAGFFDVMAWRAGQFAFLEYEDPGDRVGRAEARWVASALTAGVTAGDLWYVCAEA